MQNVLMKTSRGDIKIEFHPGEAPVTTANFLAYIDRQFFDGLIFHRVIPGFVIQGGGFTSDMDKRSPSPPIQNEAANGLKNLRGTLSMARTSDPNSATSQFFVNLSDNPSLDHGPGNDGYAVFARVVEGMDVVDAIAAVKTGSRGMHDDVPVEPVVIESARRVEG